MNLVILLLLCGFDFKQMKKILYIFGIIAFFSSCNEDKLDSESIFDTTPPVRLEFDNWLLRNYTDMYNIDFKYKLENKETSFQYYLTPAKMEKSIALAKIIKHVWLDSYSEIAGETFTKKYVPRVIHLIGSPAYENNGTMVLGTAEGGLKVTLYMVNQIDVDNIKMDMLNYYYLKTMHHEFGHILHQTKNYDPTYKLISEGKYVGGNWYLQEQEIGLAEILRMGFITPYSMNIPDDDFVELLAVYLTDTPYSWEYIIEHAEVPAVGKAILNQKLSILKKYMDESWGVDLDELRKIVKRRTAEVKNLDLKNLD